MSIHEKINLKSHFANEESLRASLPYQGYLGQSEPYFTTAQICGFNKRALSQLCY